MKAKFITLLAAISVASSGFQAKAEDMPAILKNVASKHQVVQLDKKEMNEVRGDLVLPLNLLGSILTITLLEPGTVLRVNSTGTSFAKPANSGGLNLLGLIRIGGSNSAQPNITSSFTLGVLDNGRLLNYQANRIFH